MSDFHKSRRWRKLAKVHKTLICHDCGSTKDIQSGHILAAKRFKMSRLWRINLKHQCQPCNLKQGIKLRKDLLTLKLLMVYGMIKLGKYLSTGIIIAVLGGFIYYDQTGNGGTISSHMMADAMDIPRWIGEGWEWLEEL